MAIFASTTLSGYSDPLKAQTIKALEKRLADQQAQQAQQALPESIPTPIQGVGHVVNQLASGMQQARSEQAVASAREQLAQTLQGIDWSKGPTSEQVAGLARDPDTMRQILAEMATRRENEARIAAENARHGQTVTGQNERSAAEIAARRDIATLQESGATTRSQAQLDTTKSEGRETRQSQRDLATQSQRANADLAQAERDFKAAQADLDRTSKTGDQGAKIAAEQRLAEAQQKHELARDAVNNAAKAAMPQSTAGGVGADVKAGHITPEQGAAALKPEIKPTVIKGRTEAEETYTQHTLSQEKLKQAQAALTHPGGIYTGPFQSVQVLGSQASGGAVGDKEKAQRTTDFNNIISEIATGAMSKTLKGQSTDYEMKQFQKIYNDPNSSDQARRDALDRLIRAADADKETHARAVKDFGGDTSVIDTKLGKKGDSGVGGVSGTARSPEDEAALKWATENASDPRAAAIRKKLGVP